MKPRLEAYLPAILLLGFWALYVGIGFEAQETRIINEVEMPFDLDSPRAIDDLTDPGIDHYRTRVHPLFPLFFNPTGVALARVTGRPASAALLLNAFAGAAAAALAFVFFRRLGFPPMDAVLWSALLGATSTHLVFGSLPETYAFSAFAHVLLFTVLAGTAGGWARFLPAAVFATGITSSNLAYGVIAYAAGLPRPWLRLGTALRTAAFALLAFLATGLLSLVQLIPYQAWNFFSPGGYDFESRYLADFESVGDAFRRAWSMIEHLFLVNFAGPRPVLLALEDAPHPPILRDPDIPYVRFDPPVTEHLTPLGWVHLFLWIGVLFLAARSLLRVSGRWTPLRTALLLGVTFSFGFHWLYGTNLFLYSAQWTFQVTALAALGLARFGGRRELRAGLGAVLLVQSLVNARFLADLFRIYR